MASICSLFLLKMVIDSFFLTQDSSVCFGFRDLDQVGFFWMGFCLVVLVFLFCLGNESFNLEE